MKNKIEDLDEILKIKDFMKQILQKGAGLVRLSNSLPQNEEIKYYMNNEQLKQKQKAINQKILSQIKKIASFSQYEHAQSLDLNHFTHIVGINDQLFENIDTTLDKIKKINNVTESSLFDPSKTSSQFDKSNNSMAVEGSGDDLIALATKEKPQNSFKECIDSSYKYSFIPVIKNKINAEVPLDDVILQVHNECPESFFVNIQNPVDYEFPHPYAYEIENLTYTENQLSTEIVTQEPSSLKNDLIFVNNEILLDEMIASLKECDEIAIDLEHHSYRSFNGITCLIQISSRHQDYIVDVFPVWKHLHKLNIVTSNPKIVKVLHGADMDIQWLQRDFGVYIVNLFDTGQAARSLSMPSYALAYLLQNICKVPTDKKYQLADWRIRPLPREMISYARSDTHYLLQIYDELRKQLVDRAIRSGQPLSQYIENVLNKSKTICLKKYIKPYLEDEKYHSILQNQRIILSDRKYRILKRLLEWRFINGSKYDENPTFVLPNDILFQIVNRLPVTLKEFTASFLKLSYVAQHCANEIIQIIKEELETSEEQQKQTTSVQKVNTQMETEENTQFIKNSSNNFSYSTSFTNTYSIQSEEIQEEEVSFKLETFDIEIGVYEENMNILEDHYQQNLKQTSSSQVQDKLTKINSSFVYVDPVDFYCEKYPFMREAYEMAKMQEQQIMKKRNDLTYIQKQNPFDNENNDQIIQDDEGKDEYLEFTKEKGPSSQPKQIEMIKVPDLPLSYEDQFKTNLKKRKYNFGKNQANNQQSQEQDEDEEVNEAGEKVYKKRAVGQKSTFDLLIEQNLGQQEDSDESDEGDDEEKQQKQAKKEKEAKKFNELTDKIKNSINKEPVERERFQKRHGKKGQNNYNNNKQKNKFNKSGF